MQARKTLFTPIKTETFKLQIKSLEDILAFFQSKTETDFIKQFDFNFMVYGNFRMVFNDYIETFFKKEVVINKEAVDELLSKFVGASVTHKYMMDNFQSPQYFEKIENKEKEEITNPAIILEHWKSYECGQVFYSKIFYEETEKLDKLIASPLLTTPLKDKLLKFRIQVNKNHSAIGLMLTKLTKDLPSKFPTAKSLENLEYNGVWNLYNSEKESLEPIAKEILEYIKQYLKIESLID